HELDVLLLTLPLLENPEVGQRIKVYPGCDKRLETCQNRFNNFSRFRGAPFIPIPETSV
ncbi:phage BR0599 family protein, partial [Acinetobacter baumannii]